MPRVNFVKNARKTHGDIKKDESYYWWKFRFGGRRVSKTKPKPSQLTQSEFLGNIYGLRESNESVPDYDDLESSVESIKQELETWRDEQEEKKNNMPENLQESSTGELLQERYDALDSAISELDGLDFEIDEDEGKPDGEETEDNKEQRIEDLKREKAEEIWGQVTEAIGGISCS